MFAHPQTQHWWHLDYDPSYLIFFLLHVYLDLQLIFYVIAPLCSSWRKDPLLFSIMFTASDTLQVIGWINEFSETKIEALGSVACSNPFHHKVAHQHDIPTEMGWLPIGVKLDGGWVGWWGEQGFPRRPLCLSRLRCEDLVILKCVCLERLHSSNCSTPKLYFHWGFHFRLRGQMLFNILSFFFFLVNWNVACLLLWLLIAPSDFIDCFLLLLFRN